MKPKNKTILSIFIIIVLLLAVASIFIFKFNFNKYKKHEIANIKEAQDNIPSFSINIEGVVEREFTNLSLKELNIKTYEFDAGVETSWGLEVNRYNGFKVLDMLKSLNINDYTYIDFGGEGGNHVVIKKEEITDSAYIYYYRDGSRLGDDININLLLADKKYELSVEILSEMTIIKEGE